MTATANSRSVTHTIAPADPSVAQNPVAKDNVAGFCSAGAKAAASLPREIVDLFLEHTVSAETQGPQFMAQMNLIKTVDRRAHMLASKFLRDPLYTNHFAAKANEMFNELLAKAALNDSDAPEEMTVLHFPLTEKQAHTIQYAKSIGADTFYWRGRTHVQDDMTAFLSYAPRVESIWVRNASPSFYNDAWPRESPLTVQCNSIKELNFSQFNFKNDTKPLIDASLTPNLEALTLKDCGLVGADLPRIPFAELKKLKRLDLTGNSINPQSLTFVTDAMLNGPVEIRVSNYSGDVLDTSGLASLLKITY